MIKMEFNDLITEHTDSLKMYAFQFTTNDEDANDLVQDTILKAITYYDKFQKGTNLCGWLYTIMKNTYINNYRKRSRKNSYVTQTDEISYEKLVYSSTQNKGEGKIILDDIQEALSQLTDEYYVPFTMYFEGYKYYEIADHLSIPIGTVKTRIHVARRYLKRSLAAYSGNPSSAQLA